MDLAILAALRSPAGTELLAEVGAYDDRTVLALGAQLRRRHRAELVAAAMTQARLRTRALGKLGPDASRMWFTPAGLEQASRAEVAARRAARIARLGLGCHRLRGDRRAAVLAQPPAHPAARARGRDRRG